MKLIKAEIKEINNKIDKISNTPQGTSKLESLATFYINIYCEPEIRTWSYRYHEAIAYINAIYAKLKKDIPQHMASIHKERLAREIEEGVTDNKGVKVLTRKRIGAINSCNLSPTGSSSRTKSNNKAISVPSLTKD